MSCGSHSQGARPPFGASCPSSLAKSVWKSRASIATHTRSAPTARPGLPPPLLGHITFSSQKPTGARVEVDHPGWAHHANPRVPHTGPPSLGGIDGKPGRCVTCGGGSRCCFPGCLVDAAEKPWPGSVPTPTSGVTPTHGRSGDTGFCGRHSGGGRCTVGEIDGQGGCCRRIYRNGKCRYHIGCECCETMTHPTCAECWPLHFRRPEDFDPSACFGASCPSSLAKSVWKSRASIATHTRKCSHRLRDAGCEHQ